MHLATLNVIFLCVFKSSGFNETLFVNMEAKLFSREQSMCLVDVEPMLKPIIEIGGKTPIFKPAMTSVYYGINLSSKSQDILNEYLRMRSGYHKRMEYTAVRTYTKVDAGYIRRIGPQWIWRSSRAIFLIDTVKEYELFLNDTKFQNRLKKNGNCVALFVFNYKLEMFESYLRRIYDHYNLLRVVFMVAFSDHVYEVYVMHKYDESNCDQLKVVKIGNCTRGTFSFPLGTTSIIDAVNPKVNPNCTLKICFRSQEPYVSKYCDSGIEFDFMNALSNFVHPKWNRTCSREDQGSLTQNGLFSDFLGAAAENRCDIIAGGLHPDSAIYAYFQRIRTYFHVNYVWVIKIAADLPKWKSLTVIFDPYLSAAMIINFWLMILVWTLFQIYLSPSCHEREFFYGMVQAAAFSHNQPIKVPKRTVQRILYISMASCIFITSSAYSSQMIKCFKNPGKKHQISTIEEVIAMDIPFGGPKEQRDWFQNDPKDALIYNGYNSSKVFRVDYKHLDRVAAGEIVILTNEKIALTSPKSHLLFRMPKLVMRSSLETISMGSNIIHLQLRRTMSWFIEAGMMKKNLADFRYKHLRRKNRNSIDNNEIVLTMEHLKGAFIELIIGSLLSFLVFVCETVSYQNRASKERKKNTKEFRRLKNAQKMDKSLLVKKPTPSTFQV